MTPAFSAGIEPKLSYNQAMHLRLATLEDIAGIMHFICALIPTLHAGGNLQWDDKYPNPQVFTEDIAAAQLWVMSTDDAIAGVIAVTTEQYPNTFRPGGTSPTPPSSCIASP